MQADLEKAARAAMEAAGAASAYVRFDGKDGDLSDVLVDGCVNFLAVAEAVTATLSGRGVGAPAWQPIGTAPKGVWAERVDDPAWVSPPEVQLLFDGGRQCVAKWDWYYAPNGAGAHETNGCGWIEAITLEPVTLHLSEPTHWQPLAAPLSGG